MAKDYIKQSITGAAKYLRRGRTGYKWEVPKNFRDLIDYDKIARDIRRGVAGQEAARMEIQRVSKLRLDSGITLEGEEGSILLLEKAKRDRELNLLAAQYVKAGGKKSEALKAQAYQKVDLAKLKDVYGYTRPGFSSATELRDYYNLNAELNLAKSFRESGIDGGLAHLLLDPFKRMSPAQKQVFFREAPDTKLMTAVFGSNEHIIRTGIVKFAQRLADFGVDFLPGEWAVINEFANIIDPEDLENA